MGEPVPKQTFLVPTVEERREAADQLLREAHKLLCEANELRRLAGLKPVYEVKHYVLECDGEEGKGYGMEGDVPVPEVREE